MTYVVIEPGQNHYNAVIMSTMASQIASLTNDTTVYSDADKKKHQSSASLAFVRGIHRWPVNSPHKGPVTRKMFPFDDVIMIVEVVAWCPEAASLYPYQCWPLLINIALWSSPEMLKMCIFHMSLKMINLMLQPHWVKLTRCRCHLHLKEISQTFIFSAPADSISRDSDW